MTAREAIDAAASANGWIAKRPELNLFEVEYRPAKGRQYIWVYYSMRGTVAKAGTSKRYIQGRNKRARIIELIEDPSRIR